MGKRRAWLHDEGVVQAETQEETGWQIEVTWTDRQKRRYEGL